MVNSLQSLVLFSVPIAILIDMLKVLHHLPMGHELFRALFRRCTHEELRAWARTFPWDHPIARKLDHEEHRRRMAGEFYGFFFPFFLGGCGSPFPYTILLIFIVVFKGSIFYELCCGLFSYVFALDVPDSIGPHGSGFQPVCVHFLVRIKGLCRKPTRLPYIPVGCSSHPRRSVQPLRANDEWIQT